MTKKVIDILPPKEQGENNSSTFSSNIDRGKKTGQKNVSHFKFSSLFLPILLLLIALGTYFYFTLSKAEIEICPELESRTFVSKVTIDKEAIVLSPSDGLIPGKIFTEERVFSGEFSAAGEKTIEKRAEGIIRVFNDSQQEQTLVAQTRFQPPLEKFQPPLDEGENPWFRSTEKITIPAKSYKDVRVAADAPGEKYNIESSTFSIPGLFGTPQYTFVYGKSFEPMEGGLKEKVPEVREEDLQAAEESLVKEATEKIKETLKGEIPPEFIVLEEAIESEILDKIPLAQAEEEKEKFIFQVKAKAKVVAFKKEDLENFSKKFITSQISTDKKLNEEGLKIDFLVEDINLEEGKLNLRLNIEVKIYSDIDENSLKQELAGKAFQEAQTFLESKPGIEKVVVNLWPFWVKNVPEDVEKIVIKLNID